VTNPKSGAHQSKLAEVTLSDRERDFHDRAPDYGFNAWAQCRRPSGDFLNLETFGYAACGYVFPLKSSPSRREFLAQRSPGSSVGSILSTLSV